MNIIFLDIDGVMTSTLETPGSYINHENDEYGISPTCFKLLTDLCKRTSSKIIISSNWRRFEYEGKAGFWLNPVTLKYVKNPLKPFIDNLGDLYIESLPKIRHVTKSVALKEWFNNTNIKVDNYVIFDDDIKEQFQESEFKDHFILTDYICGLTEDNCNAAYKILTK